MAVMYYDVCDDAFKIDGESGSVSIFRCTADGKVHEDLPSDTKLGRFRRNRSDSSVISEEIACRLAIDPSLSY